ncbi:MAG: hypothetical protein E5X35_11515 [Mesorhizobium sp.]|uniref:hypothetical protein n=1 Tax=unclassified Mesorhizobium TaxID=325217 RepID=UPI000FCC7DA6|nr:MULTISPECIES: hypothetical protein [unclassified Mesorhizobium]RUV65222.1 hypothetical protein EOA85_00225 [Mesorhizobium sp. M5C.F.Ca.IN.020.29.1.1]TIM87662.1 MAG: hypothetical protein E5Y50_11555 [Mesorhizobium sp.]TIR33287.1 MAG: hypothetical protein E5X35_11515 [Mesorhizobium sp.]
MKIWQLFTDLANLPAIVWNNVATTFTALKVNVIDTASAAGSLLADFQIGGVSQFTISKAGRARNTTTSTASSPAFGYSAANANGIFFTADGMMGFSATSNERGRVAAAGFITHQAYNFSATAGAAVDVALNRDAANQLGQRNGTNAQAFNLYNTFTSAALYERLGMRWVGNVCVIGAEAAGAGVVRPVQLKMTPQTVATLPVAATAGAGARMFVSDALGPAFGSAVVGGGAVNVPVYSDGANWMVG